jgi:uncharacterized membrane protein YfcA
LEYLPFRQKHGIIQTQNHSTLIKMDLLHIALLFGVGSAAGFINVNAGGGSSLTLPTLYFIGLDGALANGTNRVAILIQNIFAIASFEKSKANRFRTSLRLAVFTLPGAILGAFIATKISNLLFERILGAVLIMIIISLFISHSYKDRIRSQLGYKNWLIYPALLGIGFYGGFLQIGVGFLFMAALYHLLKLDLILVNVHKVFIVLIFIVLIYTVPALLVFSFTNNINWKFGLILAAGNAFGGWWGAQAAVKGGERVIRIVLAVAIFIMALKLFRIF